MANHPMAGAIVAAAVVVFAFTSCATGPSTSPDLGYAPVPSHDDVADRLTEEELESFGHQGDGMTIELYDLTDSVTAQYGASEGFSGFEWSQSAERLTLWWYGPVPAALDEELAAFGPSVMIAKTVNPPRALADAVARIMAPGAVPGVFVSAAGASIDCSELSVMAESTDASMSEADMVAALETAAGFPISLEIGHVIPISGVSEQ